MAVSNAKSSGKALVGELALLPLKNCLVNLPPSQVSALVNANVVRFLFLQSKQPLTIQAAQDVIVELQYRRRPNSNNGASTSFSVYAGWTGMPSKTRVTPKEQHAPMIEMDATFARTLGLEDGEKVIQIKDDSARKLISLRLQCRCISIHPWLTQSISSQPLLLIGRVSLSENTYVILTQND